MRIKNYYNKLMTKKQEVKLAPKLTKDEAIKITQLEQATRVTVIVLQKERQTLMAEILTGKGLDLNKDYDVDPNTLEIKEIKK